MTHQCERVIVVGGGIAGIAAAVALARSGCSVTLLEQRRRLGGRATSFVDAASDEVFDNCQHVALGCCTSYLELCSMLGVLDRFDWHDSQYWVQPHADGAASTSIIRPSWLPAPLHHAPSFLAAKFLTVEDKLAIAAAVRELLVIDRDAWKDRTFLEFLTATSQPASSISRFWEPVVVSACNLSTSRACATSAMQVFQDGLLKSAQACSIGIPRVAMVDLYANVQPILEASGGQVRFASAASAIEPKRVQLTSGQVLCADAVIAALPLERAMVLVKNSQGGPDKRLADARLVLEHSPIIGVHLEFDAPMMPVPHAVLVDCPTQWVFAKDPDATRLHAVISAAAALVDLEASTILDIVEYDLRRCFAQSSHGASRVRGRVVKERRATFAATPAMERWRSGLLHVPGSVVLAGDYTNTDWPATMEGAARSGFAAAALVRHAAHSFAAPQA
ncbi:MAG: hydroxysqualene dehydroxylase HpnE [Planctomycetota bacterium]|nr:hydroxysqualene dehydroxylase HpnE [Planctomycetota bacterium]